jgi:hypothetical protein
MKSHRPQNGRDATLTVRLRVTTADANAPRPRPAADPRAQSGRRVEVTVVGLYNLPKMDLAGLCDPFVEVYCIHNI